MVLVALLLGLVLGAGAVLLWARGALRARASDVAAARRELELERAGAAERAALLERSQTTWEERMKAVTGDALTKSQTSLLQLTEAKLAPIKETLQKFETQAKELEDRRLRTVSAVGEQLRTVAEGQERLRAETGNLVTALRAPHVRGRWGEVQLRRVVELAGMVGHCDFLEQESERDDTGRLLRPDMVVKLPGGKTIVVDSKVPIDAYLSALGCDDVDERRGHLQRHAGQVRDHVAKLGQKQYWRQFEPSPEFVVMFVDEGLFRAALDHDPALFDTSIRNDVVLATPSTLIALLRTVAYGWQQETVAESAREVNRLGRELHERVGVFLGHFDKVGRSLDTAVRAYNEAVGSMQSRLLATARKFPEHGADGGELPDVRQLERTPVPVSAPELPAAAAVDEPIPFGSRAAGAA
jgi:DNA recombination protein RmuC